MKDKSSECIQDDITYEEYKYLLECKREKEINDLVENKNLNFQEKIIINFERELNELKLEQKNLLFSNEEMLRLYPNDKISIESREININIYNKNEQRIKEIEEKLSALKKNSVQKTDNSINKIEEPKDMSKNEIKIENKKDNDKNDIIQELEL